MSKENKTNFEGLQAIFINCTLKKSPRQSHTAGLMKLSEDIMIKEGVKTENFRFVDFTIPNGVYPDMTKFDYEKDEWLSIFKKIMDSDILIIGTPIWLGERSSVASKFIERIYAMSGKTNEKGQYIFYGKVGGTIITGNEDGAKHCAMGILYALQHVGFTIPPQADCGWLGEIGPGPSYLDKEANSSENEFTNRNTTFMTYNLLHEAMRMKEHGGIHPYGNSKDEWNSGERWGLNNPEYR